jgi:hypothetical protein
MDGAILVYTKINNAIETKKSFYVKFVSKTQKMMKPQTTGHFVKKAAKADFCVSQDITIDASATLTQI